jgi:hypothetical protein
VVSRVILVSVLAHPGCVLLSRGDFTAIRLVLRILGVDCGGRGVSATRSSRVGNGGFGVD